MAFILSKRCGRREVVDHCRPFHCPTARSRSRRSPAPSYHWPDERVVEPASAATQHCAMAAMPRRVNSAVAVVPPIVPIEPFVFSKIAYLEIR